MGQRGRPGAVGGLRRILAVDIHQMQVRYDPAADRVLWQVRTASGELYALWLTRRMLRKLWPPLHRLVTQAGISQVAPHAVVLPEAQAMMAQAARERPLPQADFSKPFDATPAAMPQGPEPLLPTEIDLGPGPTGAGLALAAREPGGRRLALQLTADLATGLQRLLEQALVDADWGFGPAAALAAEASDTPDSAPPPARVLN